MAINKSVLYGENCIIIQLPYDCSVEDKVEFMFACAIHSSIMAIWHYVNDEYDAYREPLTVNQYPSKTYMMYKDMLDYINQYMRIELNFYDFVGIDYNLISEEPYHSDIYFAYVVDIEFDSDIDKWDDTMESTDNDSGAFDIFDSGINDNDMEGE